MKRHSEVGELYGQAASRLKTSVCLTTLDHLAALAQRSRYQVTTASQPHPSAGGIKRAGRATALTSVFKPTNSEWPVLIFSVPSASRCFKSALVVSWWDYSDWGDCRGKRCCSGPLHRKCSTLYRAFNPRLVNTDPSRRTRVAGGVYRFLNTEPPRTQRNRHVHPLCALSGAVSQIRPGCSGVNYHWVACRPTV